MCSDFTAVLPPEYGYNNKPQKVCLDCFQLLSEIQMISEPKSPKDATLVKKTTVRTFTSYVDTEKPENSYKEGYLVKKGHRRTNCKLLKLDFFLIFFFFFALGKRRFFVLKKGTIYYFESEAIARKDLESDKEGKYSNMKGAINLTECSIMKAPESVTLYKYCFALDGRKKYLIRAEKQQDYDEWFAIIEKMVKSCNVFGINLTKFRQPKRGLSGVH